MTDPVAFRKVIILCGALAVAASLAGCDDRAMDKTLADIQAIKVDARDPGNLSSPDDRKLNTKDISLALQTAKDLTVNKGGLLDRQLLGDTAPKVKIDVIDPLQMSRPQSGAPLDERPHGVVFDTGSNDARLAAAHDLPDIPVAVAAQAGVNTPAVSDAGKPAEVASIETAVHRIQVGSFGTLGAAQAAWQNLLGRYDGLGRFTPAYEKVVTASGKTMVRLKVGPVANPAQARDLCDHLDIHDNWCAKAG